MKSYLTTAFLLTIRPAGTRVFADFSPVHPGRSTTGTGSTPCTNLCATTAPKRIGENADGVHYVNDRCINCAACSHFAPDVFARAPTDTCHIVARQPSVDDAEQIDRSRDALSACPVSARSFEDNVMRNLYVTMMRNNVCNNINNLVYVVLTNYTSKNSNFNDKILES